MPPAGPSSGAVHAMPSAQHYDPLSSTPGVPAMAPGPAIPPPAVPHMPPPQAAMTGADALMMASHGPQMADMHHAGVGMPPGQPEALQHAAGVPMRLSSAEGGQHHTSPGQISPAHIQGLINALHNQGAPPEALNEACRLLDVASAICPDAVHPLLVQSPPPDVASVIQMLRSVVGEARPSAIANGDQHMLETMQQSVAQPMPQSVAVPGIPAEQAALPVPKP
jgi:hypothetical protein